MVTHSAELLFTVHPNTQCDLFYYASNIIDDRVEDMYAKEQHQVNYHGIDKKQRREMRAKKQAQGLTMSW